MAKVLVSVEHADGVAAVVRDPRGLWLAGYADQPTVLIDDEWPRIEGLHGDRTAIGGLLPAGAVGAEVVDDAGARHAAAAAGGAWVIVLDQPPNGGRAPVRYVDAAGATVPAPVAGGDRAPIPDAPEPCPACVACDWERVVPGPRRLVGAGSWQPGPMVACRACGHAEDMGTFYSAPLPAGEKPPWPESESLPEGEAPLPPVDFGDAGRDVLARAGFPVYAIPGRPAEVCGTGSSGDEIDSVTLVHAEPLQVTVTTERERHAFGGEGWLARRALAHLDDEFDTWPDRSGPAIAVWVNARERDRRRMAATAELTEGELMLEGAPARFAIATAEVGWAAVRRHGDLLITVAARDCSPDEIELDPRVG